MSSRMKDITGQKFGKLTVVAMAGVNPFNQAKCLVECECGKSKVVLANNLRTGHARSCGCARGKFFIEGKSLKRYCSEHNLCYDTMRCRVTDKGIAPTEAVVLPVRKGKPRKPKRDEPC